jgi:hypothetical protein
MKSESRKLWLGLFCALFIFMLVGLLSQAVPEKLVGSDVHSRREIFAWPALIFMGLFTVIDIIWYKVSDAETRRRTNYMAIFMALFGLAWTLGEYFANTRWIEIGVAPNALTRAPPFIELFAFAWDIIVEFSLVFIPFLAIPTFMGIIKTQHLPHTSIKNS